MAIAAVALSIEARLNSTADSALSSFKPVRKSEGEMLIAFQIRPYCIAVNKCLYKQILHNLL